MKHPAEGCAYMTEDGLIYYVLSIVVDRGRVHMKYLVLDDSRVPLRYREHMHEPGDIGTYEGSFFVAWTDEVQL